MTILTTSQAAERLGITPSAIQRLCRAGVIGSRIGRDWHIYDHELPRAIARPKRGRPKKSTK